MGLAMAFSDTQREQAEFNDAFNYVGRINLWFHEANLASSQLDAYRWFHSLNVLFRELSTFTKKGEVESFKTDLAAISKKIHNWQVVSRKRGNVLNTDLYQMLNDFELKLRRVYSESGLQMKKADGPLGAFK